MRALEIAHSHSTIYAILGVHPHNVKEIDGQTYPVLKKLCQNGKVKAYGEIGLDFFRNLSVKYHFSNDFKFSEWKTLETGNISVMIKKISIERRKGKYGLYSKGLQQSHRDGGF
jgi:Tat protein secretion system quality control protein TatD with DNase activity